MAKKKKGMVVIFSTTSGNSENSCRENICTMDLRLGLAGSIQQKGRRVKEWGSPKDSY